MITEQNSHFSPLLSTSGLVCIEECSSWTKGYIWTEELLLSAYMPVTGSESLSLYMALHVLGQTSLLGAHHHFISSQKFWLCKEAAFLPQPSKNALQSQMKTDNLAVFCRGAPSYSMDLLSRWLAENGTVLFLRQHSNKMQPFYLEQEPSAFLELFSDLLSSFLLKLHGKHTCLMLWGYKFIPTKISVVEDSLSKLLPPPLVSNVLQAFCEILLLRFSCFTFTMKLKFPVLKVSEFCCSFSFWIPYSEHEVSKSWWDEII